MLGAKLLLCLQGLALVAAIPGPVGGDEYHTLGKRAVPAPIGTSNPAGISGGQVANAAPPVSSFFSGLRAPFPTNGWWAPFAAPPGDGTAAGPFPYQSALNGNGIRFGISNDRSFDGTSIKQITQFDWLASLTEHGGAFANHKATRFDTQTVTVQYFEGDATMSSYMVPGSPYMTFEYRGATPVLTSLRGGIRSFNGQDIQVGGTSTQTGSQFTVVDTAGSTYIIYSLSTITLVANSRSSGSGTVTASGKFNGVLRVVKLVQASHKQVLDQYYQVYPTAVANDYDLTDTSGVLTFAWTTVGDGSRLLMLTWPHHRLKLQNPNLVDQNALGYLTTKGWMYGAIGNRWNMRYELSPVTWNAPRALDSSCSPSVLQGLEYEIKQLDPSKAPVPGDFYFWGGTLAAQARLALIAESLGRQDLVNPVITYLKASFNRWFEANNPAVPAYETAWGGIINKAGARDTNVDFGNGYYNDHHFHYGYFLNIAAVIAKFDSGWLNQHREFINWFARDIVNPSTQDPYFPVVRCRDWFAGHSWASGIANGAGSRDQESIGEAVNGYYGALLWAQVALPKEHVNYAKLLVATEQHAAQVYWHLYPQQSETDRNNPYPERAARDLITMGNVMDYQAGAWLFWGSQRVQITAIQILPVTPINEAMYDKQWVENVWSYTMRELTDPSYGDEWKCVIIAAYANANPQVAAAWSANLTNWGSGNTYTNELYFIGTRPNPSGTPICRDLPQNPYGDYRVQVASSGRYVTASASRTDLIASGAASGDAAILRSSYVPNAGTIQLASTNQYVNADASGNANLVANRGSAGAWERFTIRKKIGAASDVYTIKASSNGKFVTVGGDGALKNNGANEADGAGFRFVKV